MFRCSFFSGPFFLNALEAVSAAGIGNRDEVLRSFSVSTCSNCETKDCGRFILAAKSICVRPPCFRDSTSFRRKFLYRSVNASLGTVEQERYFHGHCQCETQDRINPKRVRMEQWST